MFSQVSYNVIIERFKAYADGHYLIKRFSHGQIDVTDIMKDAEYAWMHVVPVSMNPATGTRSYSFDIIFADLPRDKEDKTEYQRESLSDCIRLAEDLLAEIQNGYTIFGRDVELEEGATITPFMEEYTHVLTGVTLSLTMTFSWDWNACEIPADWTAGGSGSGGTGGGAVSLLLKTNGTPNVVQTILDLIDGTGIDITDLGDGRIQFTNTGGGTGASAISSLEFNPNHISATGNPYIIGDIVYYLGSLYRCIAINDAILPTNASYWTLIATGYRVRQAPVDWNATSGDYQILNKPTLSEVATSGDYDDLTNRPTIPSAQVNSDWDATSGVEEILNKPTIPTLTSELTNDSGFITDADIPVPSLQDVTDVDNDTTNNIDFIGSAGVFFDNGSRVTKGTTDAGYGGSKGVAMKCSLDYEYKWEGGRLYVMQQDGSTIRETSYNFTSTPTNNDDSSKGFVIGSRWILDNGDIYVCTDASIASAVWILSSGFSQVNSDWNATSGVEEILNKPTIPDAQIQSDWTQSNNTSLDFIKNKPTIPSAQIQSDWTQTNTSALDYIKNKPTIPSTIGDMTKAVYDTDNDGIVDFAKAVKTKVRNSTGAVLHKGHIVYLSGSTGNVPNAVLARANNDANSAQTFGVVYADIANNSDGFVVMLGAIDTLDTRTTAPNPFTSDTLVDGQVIYLSPTTAGHVTNVKPVAPNHLVYVGYVIRTSPTNGTIEYRIQNGYELDEIHDVVATAPVNNDYLYYDGSTSLYRLRQLTASRITDSTSVGQNLVKLTNPNEIRYIKINADNSVSAITLAQLKADIGVGGYAVLASDFGTTGTSWQNITGLSFPVVSGKTYKWKATTNIIASSSSATGMLASNAPTGTTTYRFTIGTGNSTAVVNNGNVNNAGTSIGISTSLRIAIGEGFFTASANGTFSVSAIISAGTLTFKAGSVIEWEEVL
jgi:hypothetical protein